MAFGFDQMSVQISSPKYVYRLLRDNEVPANGISAKATYSNQTVWGHVRFGSQGRNYSHFISTSKSYAAIRHFINHKGKTQDVHVRVVRIALEKAKSMNPGIQVIDLTSDAERQTYLRSGDPAENYARRFQEVLIVGNIPASAVSLIYTGPKSICPWAEPK